MSETSVQSRKMCFVEVEEEARTFFEEALPDHDVFFVDRLDEVPEDTEYSRFSSRRKSTAPFLDAHPLIRLDRHSFHRLRPHRSRCLRKTRSGYVANVGNYGENTVAEHTFALILALSRRLRDSEQAVRTGRFSRERLRGFDLRGKPLGWSAPAALGFTSSASESASACGRSHTTGQPHPFYSELLDFRYVRL